MHNPYKVLSYRWGTATPEDRVFKTLRAAEKYATTQARMYPRPPIYRISEAEYRRTRRNPMARRRRSYRRNPGGIGIMPLVLIGGAAFLLLRGGGLGTAFSGVGPSIYSQTPPPGTIVPPGYSWIPGRGMVQTGAPTTQLVIAGIQAGVPLLTNLFGWLTSPSAPMSSADIAAVRDAGLTTDTSAFPAWEPVYESGGL